MVQTYTTIMSSSEPLMNRFVAFLTPRRWWDWPFGLVFWGLVASTIAYVVEFIFDGQADDPFLIHVAMTSLIAAPLILFGLVLFRHVDTLQRELTRMASTDPLTGLMNRRAFLASVSDAVSGVMLMLDLDHFKAINDSHGHAIGDEVLCQIANHMCDVAGPDHLVGRLGGEEFAVFLVGQDAKDVGQIGGRLAGGIEFEGLEAGFRVTASVGAAHLGPGGDVMAALREADQALYRAKRDGRARLAFAA